MSRPLRLLALTLTLTTSVACGDDEEVGAGGGGGSPGSTSTSTSTSTSSTTTSTSTGDQGGGGSASCAEPDAPGAPFTLRFQNDLDHDVFLPQGCGDEPPVAVELPDGGEGRIDPESADACGFVCERVLEGDAPSGCSDCGPGAWTVVPSGETVDHVWDRRVFRTATISAACSGLDADHACAFGEELEEGTYAASVETCDEEPLGGGCGDPPVRWAGEVDLSAGLAVFVIGP